ncbi:unnamed protein product [Fructobacillus fructosus]|nr:unnamed protein product [Fructobacillus fructosus]CAK1236735.1 unnamed protein product [Fructobacillus fructosus]CAK1238018.1 unnamed protein product [Fructobacillus fructosus]
MEKIFEAYSKKLANEIHEKVVENRDKVYADDLFGKYQKA